ncbi:MAG TPA: hypothetical protein VFK56_21595 [Mycobacterium sp.]|nr:hypothetical protein [Mycobacterium sp.]
MADEKKQAPQATAQIAADEKITEKQALDDAGKVKSGFGYRYVMDRDDAGRKISRREFFKTGS